MVWTFFWTLMVGKFEKKNRYAESFLNKGPFKVLPHTTLLNFFLLE